MTRFLLPCLVCLGAAWVAPACARPARLHLAVATVRQPATSLFFVAQGSGCFAREGLAVDEHQFELGRDALTLVVDGGADAAVAFETPFLAAARSDPSLRILTALHSSTRNTRLVALRDSGIAAFADLAGKRIGFAPGTNAEFFLELALRFGSVAPEGVRLSPLAPAESVEALRTGVIDAAVLSDPPATRAEEALGERAAVVRSDLYVEFSVLAARADAIERRRTELEALLRGLACAERLWRKRPEEAVRFVRERFPELTDAELRAQLEHVTWGLGVDHLLAQVLRRESDWFRARAPTTPPPPVHALLDLRPLEATEPEAVLLIPGRSGAVR